MQFWHRIDPLICDELIAYRYDRIVLKNWKLLSILWRIDWSADRRKIDHIIFVRNCWASLLFFMREWSNWNLHRDGIQDQVKPIWLKIDQISYDRPVKGCASIWYVKMIMLFIVDLSLFVLKTSVLIWSFLWNLRWLLGWQQQALGTTKWKWFFFYYKNLDVVFLVNIWSIWH